MKSPRVDEPISKTPLPDFLERLPDGEIRIRGHRVSLYHIVDALFAGESIPRIRSQYPTIPARTLRQVAEFCDQNDELVRHYHVETRLAAEELRASHPYQGPSVEELRRRIDRKLDRG